MTVATLATALANKSIRATANAYAPKAQERELAILEQRNADGWAGGVKFPPGPRGLIYQCHDCGKEMYSPGGARKHEKANTHIVLRTDHMEDGWLEWVMAQPGRGGA